MFKKRTFTLAGYARSVTMMACYSPRLIAAFIRPATSATLREQVMLGCTSVNDCHYCDWLHTQLALKNAVDVDELNQFLANPDGTALPQETAVAVLYAQHFAEQKTRPSDEAKQRLKSVFTSWQRMEIHAYLHAIYFGNLTGNTYDALLARFKGQAKPGSSVVTETVVSLVGAPLILRIVHLARKAGDERFAATPKPVHS
ncbi:MAG: carboxymuconolactone decarboxylase family protein [Panacagrimonas sp.]